MTTLITPEYKALNAQLHRERLDYGKGGARHAETIRGICGVFDIQSMLDYGCGKGLLIEVLRFPFARGYDPCIPGLDVEPAPAELVVCTDVMEHIEPEFVEGVLDHIASLATRVVFFSISLVPAKKTLPDGRNTHLTLKTAKWWLGELMKRWELDTVRATDTELHAVMRVNGELARDITLQNNIRA